MGSQLFGQQPAIMESFVNLAHTVDLMPNARINK